MQGRPHLHSQGLPNKASTCIRVGCLIRQVSPNAETAVSAFAWLPNKARLSQCRRAAGWARQVAIVVYTDRRQAHPLILSTRSPAVAMPLSGPSAGSPGRKLGGGDRLRRRRRLVSSDIAFSSASTKVGFFSGITFSSASTEVGDARFLWREQRGGHATVPWHYWSLGLLGSRSLVRNS